MISLKNLTKTYDKHTGHANHVLKDITLTLPNTGFVCILGPSGCGKTTLLNVIGGLDVFDSGTISLDEVSADHYGSAAMEDARNQKFGYVFQNYYLLGDRSVTYNVYFGLHALPLSRLEKLKRVKEALAAVDMADYAKRKVSELSGGQQQRVALARALARRPQVIFADEPTGNLDEINTNNVCHLLQDISKSCLVVMVTHEERLALEYADRIITIEEGSVVSDCENTPSSPVTTVSYSAPAPASASVESGKEKSSIRSEVFRLLRGRDTRSRMLYGCLALFAVMTVLVMGDYMTLSTIDLEDFVITDSHIIEVNVLRGGRSGASVSDGFDTYLDYLEASDLDMTLLPMVASRTFYSYDSFIQMNTLSEGVTGFSYIPLDKLDADTLIYGRMPETPEEVVVDRFVLNKFLSGSGVLQASITNISRFLGKTLTLTQKNISLQIVGICDSSEATIYVDPYALLSIGSAGTEVMSLSQLKQMYPETYADYVLEDSWILTGSNAGIRKVNDYYNTGSRLQYHIQDLVSEDIYAQIVVNDDQYDTILDAMIKSTRHFLIYSDEKDAVKKLLTGDLPEELKGVIQVEVKDYYSDYLSSYRSAIARQLGSRSIVTATVLLAAAAMLIMLLRTRVTERLEMLSVYRLLGISNRRTLKLFALESLCISLMCALPAMLVTWALVQAATIMPSLSFSMILPLPAVLGAYLLVFLLHMAASLFPVWKLLRLPPARLAARYDL